MQCPKCGDDDIRAGELLELYYDLEDDGEPGDPINSEDLFGGPATTYFVCMACYHRWERDGSVFDAASYIQLLP